jgi:transposase-like protein
VPRTYDREFRRRVVELVRAGRPVRVIATELGLAEATVYRCKAQDLIDRGLKLGTSTSERGVRPKAKYPVIAELAGRGFSVSSAAASWVWPPPGSSCGADARPRQASSGLPG